MNRRYGFSRRGSAAGIRPGKPSIAGVARKGAVDRILSLDNGKGNRMPGILTEFARHGTGAAHVTIPYACVVVYAIDPVTPGPASDVLRPSPVPPKTPRPHSTP